jgi:hypothetical protein
VLSTTRLNFTFICALPVWLVKSSVSRCQTLRLCLPLAAARHDVFACEVPSILWRITSRSLVQYIILTRSLSHEALSPYWMNRDSEQRSLLRLVADGCIVVTRFWEHRRSNFWSCSCSMECFWIAVLGPECSRLSPTCHNVSVQVFELVLWLTKVKQSL